MTLTEFLASNHRSLSQNPLEESHFLRTQQLMQFLVIIISKGAENCDRQSTVSISEAVGHFLLNAQSEKTMPLREVFMAYTAVVSQRCPPSGLRKSLPNFDFGAMWRICIGNTTTGNLLLASAFSVYVVSIRLSEQLWCFCAWDYLSDTILLTDARGCTSKEKYGPAAIVCSTICYALSYLFRYAGNDTRSYITTSPKTVALRDVLQHLEVMSSSCGLSKSAGIPLLLELLADDEKAHFHPGTGTKALLEKFPPMGFQVVLCRDRHVPGLILIPSEAAAI